MKMLSAIKLHSHFHHIFPVVIIVATLLIGCSQENDDGVAQPVDASPTESAEANPTFASTITFAETAVPVATDPPAPTDTPVPTSTPTPDPAALIQQAEQAAFNGDDGQAVALYNQALGMLPDPNGDSALRARLAIGRSQLNAGDVAGAIGTLTALVSASLSDTVSSDAHVLLGHAAGTSGDAAGAIGHYDAALAAGDAISPYLNLWLGDAYVTANQPLSAVVPYQHSLEGAASLQQILARREKLALAYQLAGQFSAALEQYDAILAVSQIPTYRARILWESVQVLQAMGQGDVAHGRMRDVVTNYPNSSAAFSALQALLQADQVVDELQRGIVDYYNGAYEAAQQAFKRAIVADSRTNEIRYWAALNYIALGSAADAYRNLNEIIGSGPDAARYGDAMIKKGDLMAAADDTDNAAATYRELAANAPADALAPAALQKVGRIYEQDNLIEQSAQAYLAAQATYPHAEGAAESLLRGAIGLYRLGRYQEAISQTATLISAYPQGKEAALAQLWLGKAQIASGQVVSGQATLTTLAQARPDDYEGTRAAELAADVTRAPLSLEYGQVLTATALTSAVAQSEAETWLRARLGISETVDIRALQADLQADGRMLRGSELWRLGFKSEAREEFESLRADFGTDALAMYQLALYFRDIGLYRSSIGAADTLMHLANAATIAETPAFIAGLIYPIYYPDLIAAQSAEFALDPLLVAGLVRQESLYEPFAVSGAAAYGLMQVVPPTGKEINAALDWPPNYSERDLTRPYVSLRFGTYYLSKQRSFLEGDLYAALAAYNGGPGMGLRWQERSGGDPDVFFMTMPLDGSGYRETQQYIRTVGANYAIYHRLYDEAR